MKRKSSLIRQSLPRNYSQVKITENTKLYAGKTQNQPDNFAASALFGLCSINYGVSSTKEKTKIADGLLVSQMNSVSKIVKHAQMNSNSDISE